MNTYEVPRNEWRAFFDQFSRLHHGKTVEVKTSNPYGGNADAGNANTRGVPLLGITTEPEQPDAAARLEISAGDAGGIQLGHSITGARRVLVSEWNDGISAAVEIDCEDGKRTCVRVGPREELLPPGFILDGI